jgi:glutamate-1-semialdehyde 2,1-aminomutase
MKLNPASDRQRELVSRGQGVIPGGTTNSITPPSGLEFVVERGEGPYLVDVDGRKFLDFLIGGGPLILGHAHPRLIDTLQKSVVKGTHHFELTDRTIALAERLVQYVPSAEAVRFTSSGSEATFHALRLARAVTGRSAYLKFDGAYHGHHDLAAWSYEDAPVDSPLPHRGSGGIQPGVEDDVIVVPYNDAEATAAALDDRRGQVGAIIVEPYQRALTPEPGFLARLRELADEHGAVLIFDEVVTGFRTAPGGAQAVEQVTPDLTALGKALSGGLPLSALVGNGRLMDHFADDPEASTFSFHCGTFNGYLHAVEAAHTTLDIVVDEGGWKRLVELGGYAREALARTYRDAGIATTISGGGALFHAYFTDGPVRNADQVRRSDLTFNAALHRKLREGGIYKSNPKGYVSLAHSEEHVDHLADTIRWALSELGR